MTSPGDWKAWSRHVLAELERLNSDVERIEAKVNDMDRGAASCKAEKTSEVGTLKDDLASAKHRLSTIADSIVQLEIKWNSFDDVSSKYRTIKENIRVINNDLVAIKSSFSVWRKVIYAGMIFLGGGVAWVIKLLWELASK